MSRPRQYDREEILTTVTDLFWEKGFESTSMNEIVAHTKVNKFSIYNEFGGKEGLFQACIDYYMRKPSSFIEEILSMKPLGFCNIEKFFDHKVRHAALQAEKGCLIFNSVMERDVLSEETNTKINKIISEIKTLFCNCLKAAQERKEIGSNKECRELANYLTCFTFGLVNIGMKESSEEELRRMVEMTLLTVKT